MLFRTGAELQSWNKRQCRAFCCWDVILEQGKWEWHSGQGVNCHVLKCFSTCTKLDHYCNCSG